MPSRSALQRRDFLKLSATTVAALTPRLSALAPAASVHIVSPQADPVASAAPTLWAIRRLQQALKEKGIDARQSASLDEAKSASFIVYVSAAGAAPSGFVRPATIATHPESVRVASGKIQSVPATWVSSPGSLGLVYGLTDLADRVTTGTDPLAALNLSAPIDETPANEVRSAARAFCSEVEDKPWFNSKDFWTGYLDHLVSSRFNRFNLAFGFGYDFPKGVTDDYFHFPYPYLVTVPGYDVHVTPLAAGERERNMEMLRFIVAETAARGMQFQLGIWTHAYEWTDSPQAYHHITGLTPQTHAAYSRDALAMLLKVCPQITGVTMRVHGESGVPEGSYDFWQTLFQAIKNCGRPIEIDMHAKGINQIMIDMANDTGMTVKLGCKSWAEHMGLGYHQADIRELEIPRPDRMETGVFAVSNGERRFTRYGYADLFQQDRKYNLLFRLWPGTQRHLLWGDPRTVAAYSRTAHFCGASGLELCEPLTFKGREGSGHPGGRCDYADPALEPAMDWQKFAYTYLLWGRLLYNPDTAPEVWRRSLSLSFDAGAAGAEVALANASKLLPLVTTAHLPSASNHAFWPEIYTSMAITPGHPSPYSDSPKPYRFATVSPLDPQLFSSIAEFVADELAAKPNPKYSPLVVAQWLQNFANTATKALDQFRADAARKSSPEFHRWEEDLLIQIAVGRFFSSKMRAATAFEIFLLAGEAEAGKLALAQYEQARNIWAVMAKRAATIYKSDIDSGQIPQRRGRWDDRLPAIETDVNDLRTALSTPPADAKPSPNSSKLISAITAGSSRPTLAASHVSPTAFSPGKPLDLTLTTAATAADLYYRHVNQGERWVQTPMQKTGTAFKSAIPAAYTQSVYPLQYYFVLHRATDQAYHPEFNADLSNEPYFSVWHRS